MLLFKKAALLPKDKMVERRVLLKETRREEAKAIRSRPRLNVRMVRIARMSSTMGSVRIGILSKSSRRSNKNIKPKS